MPWVGEFMRPGLGVRNMRPGTAPCQKSRAEGCKKNIGPAKPLQATPSRALDSLLAEPPETQSKNKRKGLLKVSKK